MPLSRASTYPSGSSARKPSLQVPFTELPQRDTPHPQSPFQSYLKVPGRWAQVPQMELLWKEMPLSRASSYPSGSSARKPSLQVPFTELPQRETPHLQSPFQPYLKVPDRQAHSRLLNCAPIKRDVQPQSLPCITFGTPSKGALPPRLGISGAIQGHLYLLHTFTMRSLLFGKRLENNFNKWVLYRVLTFHFTFVWQKKHAHILYE